MIHERVTKMGEKERHLIEYLFLAMVFGVIFLLFLLYRGSSHVMIVISFIGAFFYTVWGVFHHLLEGRLHAKIVLEYLLYSTLVFLLFLTVLNI